MDGNNQNEELGGNLDVSQRGIQDDVDSSKPRSNTLFSYVLQGLGFDSHSSNDIPLPHSATNDSPHDSVVMKADLLISNPYMNTTEKFDELKELETRIIQTRSHDDGESVVVDPRTNIPSGSLELIRLRSAQALGLSTIPEELEGIGRSDIQIQEDSPTEATHPSPEVTPKRQKPDPFFPSLDTTPSTTAPIPTINGPIVDGFPSVTKHDIESPLESVHSHDSDDTSLQDQVTQDAIDMEAKLKDLKVPFKIRQNAQIYEMNFRGKSTFSDITLDILYSKLKRECKYCDFNKIASMNGNMISSRSTLQSSFSSSSTATTTVAPTTIPFQPLLTSTNPLLKYKKYMKQSFVNGDTRMTLTQFGTGRIDGTKDFVRFNFPINLEDINDPLHFSFENSLGANKSTLFLRRHSIWFSFYTEAYPIQAVIMSRKLLLFIPRSKESVLTLNIPFVKDEIVPHLQQVIEDWRLNTKENATDIPFEQDIFRALITLLGSKEKTEYRRMRNSLETYLGYLKKTKTNSRHQILSTGLEFHSQNLKSQLNHIMNRMKTNLQAMKEIYNEDDDLLTDSYFELMALSVFIKKPHLYDLSVEERREELSKESPVYTTHNHFRTCLEKYVRDNETILKRLELLLTLIDNEESFFRLQLTYSQNEILILNTILTILACSISFGGYLTGAFGMNLDNTETLQYERNSFLYVFVLSFVIILLLFNLPLFYFRQCGILPTFVGRDRNEKKNEEEEERKKK